MSGQVKIRLFASADPSYAVFSVASGQYRMDFYRQKALILKKGDMVIISEMNGKLALKMMTSPSVACDSVSFLQYSGNDTFTLRINGKSPSRQTYSGDLKCIPDLETLLCINTCDIESYVAGVVKAESGVGKNIEYCKTQAIIARTFLYNNFNKHTPDGYNLCDNTHCQVFSGITSDTMINRASELTRGMVILAPDSSLAIAAFHSNCGGETSPAEYVWLSSQSYLKSVNDPWCTASRNASWAKTLSFNSFVSYLLRSGFKGDTSNRLQFNFLPTTRQRDYHTGSFTLPMGLIRKDLNLRSAYFTVRVAGDSVLLQGRGYGHGVGLCQEGAMVMAERGYNFSQILKFYYSGIIIAEISRAVSRTGTTDNDKY